MSNLRGFEAGTAVGDTLVAGSVEVRTPLTSPIRIAKFGVNAFVDVGTVYDTGSRLADQTFRRGLWRRHLVLRGVFPHDPCRCARHRRRHARALRDDAQFLTPFMFFQKTAFVPFVAS